MTMPTWNPFSNASRPLRVAALCLALAATATHAEPVQNPQQRASMLDALHKHVAPAFVLDKALPLDAALRSAADEIAANHLARVDKLLSAWLDEEWERQRQAGQSGKPPNSVEVFFAVLARLLNEIALWQIEPGDADYERETLAALSATPQVCRVTGDPRYTDFASRIMRVQAMPAARRTKALESERSLLARWGLPHEDVPTWPDPLPQDAGMALLKRGLADGKRDGLALPPVLASVLLGQGKQYAAMQQMERCLFQQWWLKESLREGAAPAVVLNAFRYGTMITAAERLGGAFEAPNASGAQAEAVPAGTRPAYPKIANRFQAAGLTGVQVQLDDAGKPVQAAVVKRDVTVNGIRGVRAVAFENVFDDAMVKYALGMPHFDKRADGSPARFEMRWRLEDTMAPAAKEQGGTQ